LSACELMKYYRRLLGQEPVLGQEPAFATKGNEICNIHLLLAIWAS